MAPFRVETHERLLRNIIHVGRRHTKANQKALNSDLPPVHESGQRVIIAFLQSLHECFIGYFTTSVF